MNIRCQSVQGENSVIAADMDTHLVLSSNLPRWKSVDEMEIVCRNEPENNSLIQELPLYLLPLGCLLRQVTKLRKLT